MLDVTISLDRFGMGVDIVPLVRIAIANDGDGDRYIGHYEYWVSHQAHYYDVLPTALALAQGNAVAWKHGKISNFPRQQGAAKLLGRVMRHAHL